MPCMVYMNNENIFLFQFFFSVLSYSAGCNENKKKSVKGGIWIPKKERKNLRGWKWNHKNVLNKNNATRDKFSFGICIHAANVE